MVIRVNSGLLLLGICLCQTLRGEAVDFSREILPILADRCFACHGPDNSARQAELRLDVRAEALRVISPGRPEHSGLLERLTATDDSRMPPPQAGRPLSAAAVATLRRWVHEGARYSRHWAFVPPVRPDAPTKTGSTWARSAADLFVLNRLLSVPMRPSPEAERTTLLRRVTFDLTGLPPSLVEVESFLSDDSPNAYEQVVDRLLASPRFGEHLAASWLDAARYADTDGYQNDRYRYMHVWRDWVVMAFNRNQPFSEFVVDQLAGDMLPGATLHQQIATGFCRNHRINSEDGSIPAEWHVENVVDRVDTMGTVFLGLTIGCARCHDHKFDPISQREYYRLFAYFNNVPEWGIGPNNGNSPPFIHVPEDWATLAESTPALAPEPLRLRPARENEAGNGLKRPQPGDENTVMVMAEMDAPRPTYLLQRGQYNLPDRHEILSPGLPKSLSGETRHNPTNRLQLARWLTSPQNPLLSRVTVNRFWQQLFGTGLVKTSENFGLQGERPTYPQLLDWLAVEFREHGWDVKRLLRAIVTSATYRQASTVSHEDWQADPENRFLARGPRFRLPGFAIRDQALMVSGLMAGAIGGPPAKPYMPPKVWKSISNNSYQQDHGARLYRRSLYTYWRRTIPPPTMLSFNAAEREVCTVRKDLTNTPLQALALMNNVTFVEASRKLASRVLRLKGSNPHQQMEAAFRLVTGRPPGGRELEMLTATYRAVLLRFRQDRDAAVSLLTVGESPRDTSLDTPEHAAMTITASLILNLDESLTKE